MNDLVTWRVERIAIEFNLPVEEVSQRLFDAGAVGVNGEYYIESVIEAMSETPLRELRRVEDAAHSDCLELQNARAKCEILDIRRVLRELEPIYAYIRPVVMNSLLPMQDRLRLLNDITNYPVEIRK